MTTTPINFKRERDFGDLFNSTFNFLGQEYKRLGTVLLYYVFPLMILSAIVTTLYSVKLQEVMHSIMPASGNDPLLAFKSMGTMMGYVSLTMLLTLVVYVMLFCLVYCYIKLYVEKGHDGFTVNDVWSEMMKNFFKVFWAGLVTGLVVCVGSMFCFLPGIYFGIALSLVVSVMVFEGQSFTAAFGRSMKLVNPNWWFTFGVAIISIVLVYALSFVVSIPSVAMGFKSLFMSVKGGMVSDMNFSTGFYIVSSLTNLVSQLFIVIPVVLTAFMYYSFVEKSEKTSLLNKIDQINENE